MGPIALALAFRTGSLPRCNALSGLVAELKLGLTIPDGWVGVEGGIEPMILGR